MSEMIRDFLRAEPLQAGKLAAIVLTLLFAVGATYGYIPGQGFIGLFLVVLLSFALAFVIAVETVLTGYRSIRTTDSLLVQVADRPAYAVVRAIEVASVVVWAGGFMYLISTIPEGPMAGPGAIGLLFMMVGVALVNLGGSLLRTLAELFFHHRSQEA